MDVREGLRLSTLEPSTTIISPNPISYTTSTLVSPNSRGMVQSPRLPFASSPPSIVKPNDPSNSPYVGDGSSNINTSAFSVGEQMKKKRGRPRKYGPDGGMALALNPVSSSASYSTPISDQSCKRNRGRPPGSGKKLQMEALGAAGTGFTPHVITVKAGEDVASKIMAFSQQGTRAICILSANGAICNVTLRQPATSGGTVTYEGRFEIISLSGSFLLTENGSTRSRTGGLSVALAGSDGRVMGGGVAGMLTAATPVQVIMGSFITEGKKPKQQAQEDPLSAPPQMEGFGASTLSSPISQRTSSESEEPKSPTGTNEACTTTTQHVPSIPSYMHMAWPGSNTTNHVRHDLGMTSL